MDKTQIEFRIEQLESDLRRIWKTRRRVSNYDVFMQLDGIMQGIEKQIESLKETLKNSTQN